MDNLSSALAALVARHDNSPDKDFDALLAEVKQLAGEPPATGYEYRNNPGWDSSWFELDESQLDLVLERGHHVQRRRIVGDWEDYTGGPRVPEPAIGIFPVDVMAPRPATPHSERIFAASKDLYDAWSRGESWALEKPLHESYVIFFLETISDAVVAMVERWNAAGRPGNYPDSLAVHHELARIICLEDRP